MTDLSSFESETKIKCIAYNMFPNKSIWECNHGHQFEKTWKKLRLSRCCPVCVVSNSTYTVSQVIDILSKENYKILDVSKYKNTREKLDLICPKGHIWNADVHKFFGGYRCFECGGSQKNSHIAIKSEIESKGYKLLSEYKNAKKHITIQCPNGHVYETLINTFRRAECKSCMYDSRKVLKLDLGEDTLV
jgi:hypothetical protein